MAQQKSIVIGCDNADHLSAVMNTIKGTPAFSPEIISATRISDLLSIVRSVTADLVIFCFRNNQFALNDFDIFVKKPAVPVLCLTQKTETGNLRWNPGNIVFTCPFEHVKNDDYLNARIHSIFLLSSSSAMPYRADASLADIAAYNTENNVHDLSRYVLELDQKTEALQKIKGRITDLFPQVDDATRRELMSIVNAIRLSANNSKLWEDFRLYFEQMNPGFLLLLAEKHPELTQKDLKYCCYLKMNMSNDDIKKLLGINQESVRTHKYRLKKKMELSPEQDLVTYLRSVGKQGR
ncbi:MAG TPA: hypothetical protein VFU15_17605 [Bacteroidia bacterium]|nr:hypothetical protein [Bacteroidia bacterium]